MYRHTAPRRLSRKMLLIFRIHIREILHINKKCIDLDNFCDIASGRGQNGFYIRDTGGGFFTDGGGGGD
jgi:hypothetical protein